MDKELYEAFYRVEQEHRWFRSRRHIVSRFIEKLQVPNGSTVIDVWCGTGAFLEELGTRFNAWGVDSSPMAVDFCQSRGIVNVHQGSLDDLDLPDNSVPLITLMDVIEHLDDDSGMLEAAREKLGPGGHAIITVPAYQFLWTAHDTANMHKRRYIRTMLNSVVTGAGLEVKKISYYNTILFPLMALSRLAEKLLGSQSVDSRMKTPARSINWLFERLFSAEYPWLSRFSFPYGGSLICIARKPHQLT